MRGFTTYEGDEAETRSSIPGPSDLWTIDRELPSMIAAGVARVSRTPKSPERPRNDRLEAATYLAAMVAEMTAISRRNDFDALTYVLDMARLEVENTVQRLKGD